MRHITAIISTNTSYYFAPNSGFEFLLRHYHGNFSYFILTAEHWLDYTQKRCTAETDYKHSNYILRCRRQQFSSGSGSGRIFLPTICIRPNTGSCNPVLWCSPIQNLLLWSRSLQLGPQGSYVLGLCTRPYIYYCHCGG